MNREQKRELQKRHKYIYSAEEFEALTKEKQIRLVKRLTKTLTKQENKS